MATASRILRNLWLGRYTDAHCTEFLEQHKISVVLCVCDVPHITSDQFECIVIFAHDCASPNEEQTIRFGGVITTCVKLLKQRLDDNNAREAQLSLQFMWPSFA